MAVLTDRFPSLIAKGAEGGWPGWLVSITAHAGGQETPVLLDPHPLGRWNVSRAIEKLSKHEVARRHFIMARGSFHRFRFKDWTDYTCTRTGSDRGELIGSGTSWQCTKTYGADDATFRYRRSLTRIVALTDQVWRNGALQTRGSDYTIDNDTGVITSSISWTGATLELACQFDVLCRYDIDRLSAVALANTPSDGLKLSWTDIDIVEVREEE
jgi:uncharacterized protein (TIGR02217 family)